jgi:glutamine synthetase
MDVMKKLALKHGLVCLLHEKPFAGVNGSGKHNNWSICTDDGINLLDPGNSPSENAQFLLFLTAVIKAVEENADLLRIAVASAGNDHRLGANEAPPAIISIFLGEELTDVVDCIIEGKCATSKASTFDIGLSALPKFPKDTTDRNRTSPFAFTGNKFEFRSLGSAFNIAGPNIVLNTIVADALKEFADELEKAEDFNIALQGLIVKTLKEKKRIIFNGNNYSEEWVREAEKRGLPNYRSTVDALPHFADKKNVELFVRHKVFSEIEVHARMEILIESYNKALNVEALTTLEIAKRDIIPAVIAYEKKLADTILAMKSVGVKTVAESSMINNIANLLDSLYSKTLELEKKMIEIPESSELEKARYFHDVIFVAMQELRAVADSLETAMPSDYWPMPTYADLLFYI